MNFDPASLLIGVLIGLLLFPVAHWVADRFYDWAHRNDRRDPSDPQE